MMLHEKTLKTLLVNQIKSRTEDHVKILGCDSIYFDEPIENFIGVKLHHGYPFFFDSDNRLTYPRGMNGQIIVETIRKFQGRKCYVYRINNGLSFKVRMKKI